MELQNNRKEVIMDLNERIKNYRKENHLTQQELADMLFVSRSLIAKWEQGRGIPTSDVLEKLAKLLDVPFTDLIGEKEIKACTVDTNQRITSNKKLVLILLGVAVLLLIGIAVLIVSLWSTRTTNSPPASEQSDGYFFNQTELFYTAVVDEEYLYINHKGSPFNVACQISLDDENIEVYDKYYRYIPLSDIKTGYKLRLWLSFYDDGKDTISTKKLISVDSIYVVEDYLENDYYVKGFFLSAFPYEGNEIPIFDPSIGYSYSSKYVIDGVEYPTREVFPYFLSGDTFGAPVSGLPEYPNERKPLFYSPFNSSLVLKEEIKIPVKLDNEVDTLYVYALDNSEKGFFEYGKITHEQPTLTLSTKWIKEKDFAQKRFAHSFDYDLVISASYVHGPFEIREFDKDGRRIKSSEYYSFYELPAIFYLDEST